LPKDVNLIYSINGPVVTVKDTEAFAMQEMVRVGKERLVGEVIGVTGAYTTIQVYEDTSGVCPGEPVVPMGIPVSARLGPGMLTNIYDGIQRPLRSIESGSGAFITRGAEAPPLDMEKKWDVTVTACVGDALSEGMVYATCPETSLITHRFMAPPGLSGRVKEVKPSGLYDMDEDLILLEDEGGVAHWLGLSQIWPIRTPRPIARRQQITRPLITGQRVVDTLFPVGKGGTAAIPGGFGTGKTMTQHQLAKWCDADIIVYVGCGERGNEMTQALNEFEELIDPKSQQKLTDRTILIANTSNMPVAAREASIYTGITIAEYYRDMGYHVALMADSTSRWAEALREISGRLEEMPAEEGFPAYLPSRLSEFYERAGYVSTLSGYDGSITIIGAVSPQGSDFSEPVTQNTKRFTRCFWALDKNLAYARHYPAINWTDSYSEYIEDLSSFYAEQLGSGFLDDRRELIALLHEESQLLEIVKLIGSDILPDDQKLVIEAAKLVRAGFLQQNAFHAVDTYVPLEKQALMMRVIMRMYERGKEVTAEAIPIARLMETGLFDKLTKMKFDVDNEHPDELRRYLDEIDKVVDELKRSAKPAFTAV
jgi:V/A-type H+-transporting ATPase subunit A